MWIQDWLCVSRERERERERESTGGGIILKSCDCQHQSLNLIIIFIWINHHLNHDLRKYQLFFWGGASNFQFIYKQNIYLIYSCLSQFCVCNTSTLGLFLWISILQNNKSYIGQQPIFVLKIRSLKFELYTSIYDVLYLSKMFSHIIIWFVDIK